MTDPLKRLLEDAFPDALELRVIDRGGGDHLEVQVTAPSLDGLSRIDQHKRVYAALAAPLADGSIHELRIKTRGTAET
jgi:stress-induced morphogen